MKQMLKTIPIMAALAVTLTACGNAKPEATAPADHSNHTSTAPATEQQATKKQYEKAPEMKIDQNKTYTATIQTSMGDIKIELFAKDAPKTVNNFVFLSKEKFYDNVVFHRIIKSFMIQTGDPQGSGAGGPGYSFEDELNNGHSYEPGVVAMANAGPNTNGSQFFIGSGADVANLNQMPNYTIFGKVVAGMDVVEKIASAPVEAGPSGEPSDPVDTITIKTVNIEEK